KCLVAVDEVENRRISSEARRQSHPPIRRHGVSSGVVQLGQRAAVILVEANAPIALAVGRQQSRLGLRDRTSPDYVTSGDFDNAHAVQGRVAKRRGMCCAIVQTVKLAGLPIASVATIRICPEETT